MKKYKLIVLALLFFSSAMMGNSSDKSKLIKPTNFQKKVTTLSVGKKRSYYSLSDEKPSTISIQGPGKLRVITRGRFVSKELETINYEVRYTIDGGEQNKVKIKGVERAAKATYLNAELGIPGQLEDFEIELGRGQHSIDFYLEDNSIPVAGRYIFTPTKAKKKDWIGFSPDLPSEPVDLISRESTVTYYRFSKEKPLKIKIIGPTELRILSRLEIQYQMKGRINYRVQVKEGDAVINTYQLSSRSSEITVYEDNEKMIPGKACEFVIQVPKGKHSYELSPLDQDKKTLLGRILLPKQDVKLKE